MQSISYIFFVTLTMLVLGLQIVPKIVNAFSKENNNALTLFFLLAIAIGFGWIISYVGVSSALGSFIAGLIASTVKLSDEANTSMRPLRDLFAGIFFISIGLALPSLGDIYSILLAIGIAVFSNDKVRFVHNCNLVQRSETSRYPENGNLHDTHERI